MTGFSRKEDVLALLKSYVSNNQLQLTRKQITDEVDKIYAKNTQLANYMPKDQLIKELEQYAFKKDVNTVNEDLNKKLNASILDIQKTYVKTDDLNKNFVNKTADKAVYSEGTVNDNNTYITPLYWGQRYVANRSSPQEKDDNEIKYVTPKFLSDRKKTWTVSAEVDNQFIDISDDKFTTPAWTTSKINKEKDGWTVSSANDRRFENNDDKKFVTANWANNKFAQQKNLWTVSSANDPKFNSNVDDKFVTANWTNSKINRDKNEWTVNTVNDKNLESVDDAKFITPGWANAKITQQKNDWTVSVSNDNTLENNDDTKFPTVKWTNTKLGKEKSNWTTNLANDEMLEGKSDDNFASVAWINKKIDTNKTNSTVSFENDNKLSSTADDKFTTAGWTTEKLKQQRAEWTTSFSNDAQLKSKDDAKFTTPEWVNKKIDSFIPRKPEDDLSDNKFVTTRYLTQNRTASDTSHAGSRFHFVSPFYLDNVWFLNKKALITDPDNTSNTDKYVTPDFVTKRMNDFMKTSAISINTTTEATLANRIAGNSNFVERMAGVLKDNENLQKGISDIMTNIDNPQFNRNNTEYLSSVLTQNLLSSSNDRYLLVDSVANRLANEYRNELTRDIGSSAARIDTLRLKLGQSVTQLATPFQTSQENAQNVITSGKFGFTDAEVALTVGSGTNNPFIDAKNSYLELRGGARAYRNLSSQIRQKRRVKVFDDLLVDNKVAIGPNVDTLSDDPRNPIDKYHLKVGGPSMFTNDVDVSGKINLQNDWRIDTSDGKFTIYRGNEAVWSIESKNYIPPITTTQPTTTTTTTTTQPTTTTTTTQPTTTTTTTQPTTTTTTTQPTTTSTTNTESLPQTTIQIVEMQPTQQ
jgi:hypothetical protein